MPEPTENTRTREGNVNSAHAEGQPPAHPVEAGPGGQEAAAEHGGGRERGGRGGRQGGLSRQLIIERAVQLIDDEGVTALTMRALGSALGVEAMSLYRHVNGREDLLEGVVDHLVTSIRVDPGSRMQPNDGWQAFLQWIAHQVRELALQHPAAFPLIATRHPAAPWLRPPLRSLEVVEGFLDGLRHRGFDDARAVAAYRSFSSFLLGHLLLESAMQGVAMSQAEEPVDEGDAAIPNSDGQLDLSAFPTVARLRTELAEDHTEDEFEKALEHLLVRIDLEVSQ